ncbi:MAG: type II toxin-antitoxin system VapC family toxin [Dehalococcoidia bacterium]
MILLDTSGLLAALDDRQPEHVDAANALLYSHPRILSPFVLAELDYLLATRTSQATELRFLDEVADGAYQLAPFDSADVADAADIIRRYADLDLGLADASIVVLADRYNCADVLTLDQRHFRAIRGPRGRPFRLLPFDM